MRIHSSISRLTPFWLSHFFPGSEGLFEFLALWRISKLSPGCRTRQDAEVAVLPFFTQWHMWPGPPFPPCSTPPGCWGSANVAPKLCVWWVCAVIRVHKRMLGRLHLYPREQLPDPSRLSSTVHTFPWPHPHPPQQQGRSRRRTC